LIEQSSIGYFKIPSSPFSVWRGKVSTMTQLILYTSEDGKSQIQLRADGQTVWLTQLEMAELFSATKQNISLHLKNLFEDAELNEISVVKESLTTATDGKRYATKLYNLDAILAVGYRVRSSRGVQFRRWASTVLKEYLLKGFAMDDERLKNPDGRPDYFDEMLARIRDIRASEKRFYQKVRPHFGLLSWKGAQVRKQDIVVAKNYLTEDEIDMRVASSPATLWQITALALSCFPPLKR